MQRPTRGAMVMLVLALVADIGILVGLYVDVIASPWTWGACMGVVGGLLLTALGYEWRNERCR